MRWGGGHLESFSKWKQVKKTYLNLDTTFHVIKRKNHIIRLHFSGRQKRSEDGREIKR